MLYLAGQILVFVLVAMLLGAGLAWFFLLGPIRRPAVARAAPGDVQVRPGEVESGGVRPGEVGPGDDAGFGDRADGGNRGAGRADDAPGVAVPGALPTDLAAPLREQEDAWARERAELTARLDAAERQTAESELRVAAAEHQVGEAERRVAEIEFQLREAEEGVSPGVGKSDGVAVGTGGNDAPGSPEHVDPVAELARETTRLREALADAESRAAKISARLAIARTEAEDAQRSATAMAMRLDRHQAEWAAEKAELTALIHDDGAEVGPSRPGAARDSPTGGGAAHGGTGVGERRPAFVQEDRVYGLPPAVAALSGDDLKEIVGIGEAVEARLHTLGITSFRQIALMGDADVDRLARKLDGFGDRIVSDDWVGQARELQARYHGGLA